MKIHFPMSPLFIAVTIAGLGITLAGCSNSSNSSPVATFTGIVVGSYYQNAKVCLDDNNNAVCDATETSTRSDANGNYTLPLSSSPIVAEIGTDASKLDPDTNTTTAVIDPVVFRAPAASGVAASSGVVSALSTLVVSEIDSGSTASQALATVATRLGITDSTKLFSDFNKESDPLVKSQLLAHSNNTTAIIKAAKQNISTDLKTTLNANLASKNIDPNVLYVWTQIGANDTTPFSKIQITSTTASAVLNADPVKNKIANTSTYTVTDASNGSPFTVGALYARAITQGTVCPQITIDGKAKAMTVRAPAVTQVDTNGQYSTGSKTTPVKADFNVLTCEALIPDGSKTAVVNGRALKLLNSANQINRVVVVGDTGCRIKGPAAYSNVNGVITGGDPLQDCSNDRAWPYKRIAAAAASFNPDLILHNGDLHYREGIPVGVENPPGIASAVGAATNEAFLQQKNLTSTVTYGWAAWEADFFKPSGPLLAAAPWAITRGNHESCFRAGTGWFHFLDPRPFNATEPKYSPTYDPTNCSDYIDPIVMTLKDLQIVLLDNSGLQDSPGQGRNQGWTHGDHIRTARQLNAISNLPASADTSKVTWIVTHKPMFAYINIGGVTQTPTWQYQKAIADSGTAGTETYAGANGKLPANTQMLHAGHLHGWQMISHPASSNLPTSFLMGESGDTLDTAFMTDTSTGAPLAPTFFGNNITSGTWPWLGSKAALWFGSLAQYLPDSFSSTPIVNAGTAQSKITEFGFVVYDRIAGTTNWKGTFYDMDRKKVRTCTTIGKRTTCDN